MDDETNLEDYDFEEEYSPEEDSSTSDAIENVMMSLFETASVEAVYGAPVSQGDMLIIPAAEVVAVGGFGMGSGGTDESTEKPGDVPGYSGGSGGGGGGSTFSRPVAVIIAGPGGVRVEPVIDITKIALAGITAGALALGMISQMRRMRRSLRAVERGMR